MDGGTLDVWGCIQSYFSKKHHFYWTNDGWRGGWADKPMDGQMDAWTDGWREGERRGTDPSVTMGWRNAHVYDSMDCPNCKRLTLAHPRCILTGITMEQLTSWAQELSVDMLWSISITLSLVRYFTFKGSIWRPIPAHPRCNAWHNGGVAKCAWSKAFDWYAELLIDLSDRYFQLDSIRSCVVM